MARTLLINRKGAAKHLSLNRPNRANSLDSELVSELEEAIRVSCDDGTRTLILSGIGASFCSGFDLGDLEHSTNEIVAERILNVERMLQALHHAPPLTVALVHGRAFGAGADLACACRWRIGSPESNYSMPGLNFGIYLGTRRLAQKIGSDNAQRMLINTPVVSAQEAHRIGFLTQIANQTEWPEIIEAAKQAGSAVKHEYVAKMIAMTTPDSRKQDMQDLKRSVDAPDLIGRIVAYRNAIRSQAGKQI